MPFLNINGNKITLFQSGLIRMQGLWPIHNFKTKTMSKREEAIVEVNKIILDNFDKIDPNDLIAAEDDTLLSDLGLDSIDACELEMEFERVLDVVINDVPNIKTYGELVSMYENNLID